MWWMGEEAAMELQEPLMTSDEVAAFLRVDVVTVRRLVTRGELAAYRVGGEYRFARGDLLTYLERQRLPVKPSAVQAPGARMRQLSDWLVQALYGATPSGVRQHPLSRRAERSVRLAIDEASAGGGAYLGTEHLLLGLIREQEGVAARALAEVGITIDAVRATLAAAGELPERPAAPAAAGQEPPLTDLAGEALGGAVAQAREWEHEHIGTEHLLFALTRASEGNAAFVLEQLGTAPDVVQAEVLHMLGLSPERPGWEV
jgi:excisionase family DNA binding protein